MRPRTAVPDNSGEHQLDKRYDVALFDALPTPITVFDAATGRTLAANRAFLDLVGLELDTVEHTTPPYPWSAPGGATFRRPDGRSFPVRVTTHELPGGDEAAALRFSLVTDLSDTQRLEQQLVQSGKFAAIGELAAGVAHEINNPLFAILGLTEFLLAESQAGTKQRSRLELIQQTGLEIKEIVQALLDFARESADDRRAVALEDVVRSTVDLVRRTNAHKGVELVDTYDGSKATVNATPNQLKQLFLNLIANARQAMPHGGGRIEIDVRREGEHVLATVSDDGPGVPPELVDRIFEPFFTTRRESGGTGLGLSASLGIAEGHGGTLTVTTATGRGAAFTVRLPVSQEGDA